MTVTHNVYVIIDIIEMQKAEINTDGIGGFAAGLLQTMKNPDLDMYQIKAILKSYIEKTGKGRKLLKKLGHGDKLDDLDMKYLEYQDAFTAYVPVTHKTLNINKYHVGGEIMIAYYPTEVWATWHCKDAPDNNDDKRRIEKNRHRSR